MSVALVAEACRKSAVLWLTLPGRPQPLAAWHVWQDDAALCVHEGGEQHLPGLAGADQVEVAVRSKDTGGWLVSWLASAEPVPPGTPEWAVAAAALHAARLNAPDGEAAPDRWARESRITRLVPVPGSVRGPGELPTDGQFRPPVPSPATTRGPLPFVLGRRRRPPPTG